MNPGAIRFAPEDFDGTAWQDAIAPFLDKSLLQDFAFGAAKAQTGWRVERGLFRSGDSVLGAAQMAIRDLPLIGGGLVWLNRGPLWRKRADEPTATLAALLAALAAYWRRRGYYLRVAPPAETLPEVPGYRSAGALGWASALLDLAPAEEDLRKGLEQKWRNALNKAEKAGFEPAEDLDLFLKAFARFVERRDFATSVTPELLEKLEAALPAGRKMQVHLARRDGNVLGGALVVRYGDTAEYLAGFLEEPGRGLNVGQWLLWRAIVAAKRSGALRFDLGGMDAERTPPGIYRFKAGVGGVPYRLAGEIEAEVSDLRARLVRHQVRRALAAGGAG